MRFSDNHHSALQTPQLVDKKIRHEIDLGQPAGPFQEIPFPNFQSSPLGLVSKHEKGKFRLIHDLSFPKGDFINFHTSREFITVQYEYLDRVAELVRACGHKCLIAKADTQEAFRLTFQLGHKTTHCLVSLGRVCSTTIECFQWGRQVSSTYVPNCL